MISGLGSEQAIRISHHEGREEHEVKNSNGIIFESFVRFFERRC